MSTTDTVSMIRLIGTDLDEATGGELLGLVNAVDRDHRLHLDFDGIQSVGALGLAKLVTLHKKMKDSGGHLALVNVEPLVYEILEVTRLTTVMDVRQKRVA